MITITKYSTPTCVNCKILSMRLKPIVESHKDLITFQDFDITSMDNPPNIQAVPHLIVTKDGETKFEGHVNNVVETIKLIQSLL